MERPISLRDVLHIRIAGKWFRNDFLISGLLCLIKNAQREERMKTDLIAAQSIRLTGMGLSCQSRSDVLRVLPTAPFAERSILTSFQSAQG